MPISRDEFEKGRTGETTEAQVERFLQTHAEQAFTAPQVAEGLYGVSGMMGLSLEYFGKRAVVLESVEGALQKLIGEGKIRTKGVDMKHRALTYYTIA